MWFGLTAGKDTKDREEEEHRRKHEQYKKLEQEIKKVGLSWQHGDKRKRYR